MAQIQNPNIILLAQIQGLNYSKLFQTILQVEDFSLMLHVSRVISSGLHSGRTTGWRLKQAWTNLIFWKDSDQTFGFFVLFILW